MCAMVVEYERCLSDCSQDGMNDRKREALICCAWLLWHIHQEMFVDCTNQESGNLEMFENYRRIAVVIGALF